MGVMFGVLTRRAGAVTKPAARRQHLPD